jgi:hypothetical protein
MTSGGPPDGAGVRQPGDAAREPHSLGNTSPPREQRRSQRPVRQEGAAVAFGPQHPNHSPKAGETTILAALVEDDRAANRRLPRRERLGLWRHYHVDRAEPVRQLLDKGKGEDDIAQEGGLDDQRPVIPRPRSDRGIYFRQSRSLASLG